MSDVLIQLKPLSWRGILLPITGRQVGFSHGLAKHKFQFRDGIHPEPTGRGELTFRYSVPMRENIAKGPYKHLFIDTLPKLWAAMQDRKPGPLNDPVHGEFDALPVSYSETLDVAVRDGVDLEIDFIHAPSLDEAIVAGRGLSSVTALASDLAAMTAAIQTQEWLQEIHEEVQLDLLDSLTAVGDQLQLAGDQFTGKFDKVAFQMDQLTDVMDELEDPETWPFRDTAQNFKESALRLRDSASDPASKIVNITIAANQTITAVSASLGIDTEALLALNESLAETAPLVPKGTVVFYEPE